MRRRDNLKKILITGGAGYKGILLARELLERGLDVTILDNFLYGVEPTLHLFRYPGVSFVRKDIRSLEQSDVKDFDCIFHLAAISSYPACESNPHSAVMININATKTLLSYLSKSQLIVYASTTSLYGTAGVECHEDAPVKPTSLYAKSKYEAEQMCMQRENAISFRFATLFGVSPRMRWDLLLNTFVMKAISERTLVLFDAHSTRTFLHVSDAIKSYLMTLDHTDKMTGQIFNVGDRNMNYSKMQLAEMVHQKHKFEIINSSLDDLDFRTFIVNFDKIEKLGFKPSISIDDGINELIKLFLYYNPVENYRVI